MRDSQAQVIYLKDYQVPEFLIEQTELDFDCFDSHTAVSANLLIKRNKNSDAKDSPLVLDGQNLDLKSVSIDGQPLQASQYTVSDESLTVHRVPDEFVLSTVVEIDPASNKALEGLYRSQSMYCTQCEAQGFRKITYFLDRPDVLSVFTTTITADKSKFPILLSNGDLVSQQDLEDGRHTAQWKDPHKKPCYLFALVAGDLEHIEDQFTTASGRDVLLQIYVESKDIDKCDHAMLSLKAAMKWDEEVYGREYDLDRYMIVAVDDFNMGAMENKGLNIFNTSCVLAHPSTTTDTSFQRVEAVVAHEYFHNWSGNRVTCRDWFQLSLKEGFTVYRDAEFSADMNSRGVKRINDVNFLRTYQFPEDAGPMAHPIRPASFMEISNFYTVTVYEKGAEVVRMLAHLLGPKKFRQATDLYFERFDGQAVTTDDFVHVMEEVLGESLDDFRNWYSQAGTPKVAIKTEYQADQQRYIVHAKQSCRETPETPKGENKKPFVIPLVTGLVSEAGDMSVTYQDQTASEHVLVLDKEEQTFTFENVTQKPVLSTLRGFSAPIELVFEYSLDELAFLWKYDTDPVTRWDAGQRMMLQTLDALLSQDTQQAQQLSAELVSCMQFLLENAQQDQALLGEMLILPNETYIAEQYEVVDVHAIHQARDALMTQVADSIDWQSVYQAQIEKIANMDGGEYQPNAQQIAARQLKNLAMKYMLSQTEVSDEVAALVEKQYSTADNMTDQLAALQCVAHATQDSVQQLAPSLLNAFYEQWSKETLVVNLWLQVQAANPAPNTLTAVRELMQHPSFDANNPNKLRSLISVFAGANPTNFHQPDGEGYAFLADQVIALDKTNPQVASRLASPLSKWKRYPQAAQEMMKAQLQRILDVATSKDVKELLIKSLK